MRVVPQKLTDIWKSGVYTGKNRPIARVTIQRTQIVQHAYSGERYATYLFGYSQPVLELPNVKSVKWTRSIDADAGTCDIELYNAKELPIGVAPNANDPSFNQPGYFTFNRGDDTNRWGHTHNGWTHRVYPDMLIRTYEGYGYDKTAGPEDDANMMPSGVWIIDDVILTADAMITLKCRDASRLLMDQICFPPVVPAPVYPLKFEHFTTLNNPLKPVITGGARWINPSYDTDSSAPYGGPNLNIGGHRASDAFDGSDSTYWVSIGNGSPTADYAYEWVQAKLTPQPVSAVRIYVKGGPYRVYVSLHDATKGWLGNATIPYNPSDPVSAPNGSNIRYVTHTSVPANQDTFIDVKDAPNINKVRITFHDLSYIPIAGHSYNYRAAVRDFDILVGSSSTTWQYNGTNTHGNYSDYTDIVKALLGYGGFLWPGATTLSWQMTTGGRVDMPVGASQKDAVLLGKTGWFYDVHGKLQPIGGTALATWIAAGKSLPGAIWGDLENSGTYGPADLTTDIFDKKPLMDGVAYIRDMLGFIFYIDESGAAVFRSPNIWSLGNWQVPADHRIGGNGLTTRVNSFVEIDEKQTLIGLQATLSGRNIRERIVVANIAGNIGAVTKGFLPYKLPAAGLRRVAIWSDQHFQTEKECQIMADLIAVRQLFTYRTDTVTIPGYPAIQIDDQVKITERVTEEAADVHYVKGVTSTLDMSTGDWTYQLDTHWLGTEPFGNWAFNPANLASDTQAYLRALGKIT